MIRTRLLAAALLIPLSSLLFSNELFSDELGSKETSNSKETVAEEDATPLVPGDVAIKGRYLEARLQGQELIRRLPTIRNAGTAVAGRSQTILSWRIDEGIWNGLKLDGLSFALVVDSKRAPLGPVDKPPTLNASIYLDEKANKAQEEALLSLAYEFAAEPMKALRKVRRVKIQWHSEDEEKHEEHEHGDDEQEHAEQEELSGTPDGLIEIPKGSQLTIGRKIRIRAMVAKHLHENEDDHSICSAACGGQDHSIKAMARHAKAEKAAPVGFFWIDQTTSNKVENGYRLSDSRTVALGTFQL